MGATPLETSVHPYSFDNLLLQVNIGIAKIPPQPDDGCEHPSCRYVAWVTAAFGPFWGFQEGWWSWLSGVTDNSVYPVLFLTYLDAVVPGDCSLPFSDNLLHF